MCESGDREEIAWRINRAACTVVVKYSPALADSPACRLIDRNISGT